MTIGWRAAAASALILAASGCMTYRGPRGVEDSLEQTLGVELHRDSGIKLGFLSTKFVASFVGGDGDDDLDFHDLSSIGVAVFERGAGNGKTPRRIEPRDLGLTGYDTLVRSADGDEQILLLVKPRNGKIREMVLLTVDADEVMVARLTGHLDEFIAKAVESAEHDGVRGARAAVSLGD
jgi:hypothetical protein